MGGHFKAWSGGVAVIKSVVKGGVKLLFMGVVS